MTFIKVHHVITGKLVYVNAANILEFYSGARQEHDKEYEGSTRILFNDNKYFDARESCEEVYEKIKAATESNDTKKPTVDQSAYMVRGIE